MKKLATAALLALVFAGHSYAQEKTDTSPIVPSAQNSEVDVNSMPVKDTNTQPEMSQPTESKVESHSPISFLQGQLKLTPEQVEQTKDIFRKHYNEAKDEFSEILTPDQKARLEFLEKQDVQQTISL